MFAAGNVKCESAVVGLASALSTIPKYEVPHAVMPSCENNHGLRVGAPVERLLCRLHLETQASNSNLHDQNQEPRSKRNLKLPLKPKCTPHTCRMHTQRGLSSVSSRYRNHRHPHMEVTCVGTEVVAQPHFTCKVWSSARFKLLLVSLIMDLKVCNFSITNPFRTKMWKVCVHSRAELSKCCRRSRGGAGFQHLLFSQGCTCVERVPPWTFRDLWDLQYLIGTKSPYIYIYIFRSSKSCACTYCDPPCDLNLQYFLCSCLQTVNP